MVIILYGEDQFRSLRRLAELREAFLARKGENSSVFYFDFDSSDSREKFFNSLETSGGLFSAAKLIIAKRLFSSWLPADLMRLDKFLKNGGNSWLSDKDNVLIIWEETAPKGDIFKSIKAKAKAEEFRPLSGNQLEKWYVSEAKMIRSDMRISEDALRQLVAYIGNDLFLARNSLEKLANFKPTEEITKDDVEELVNAKLTVDIFKTIDAICANKAKALELIHKHLAKGEDPFYLLSMIAYQFRNLIKISFLDEKGLPPNQIAARAKIHPYVVSKSLASAKKFGFAKLKEIYKKLSQIDFGAKTGKTDLTLAIDKLIVKI